MPGEFTRSPQLLKGALAVYPSQRRGNQPRLIVFQYNPEQLRRTLARRAPTREAGNAGQAREDAQRVPGPPVETLNLSVTLDATDQLEQPQQNRAVAQNGLQPVLATLELLLYPPSSAVQQNQNLARQGAAQVNPLDIPLILLVWGRSRVVPVQLTSFSVTEEAFDPNLNPIQAKVELGLQVLTYMELQPNTLGYDAYQAYQQQKENLAGQAQPRGDESRIRGLLPT